MASMMSKQAVKPLAQAPELGRAQAQVWALATTILLAPTMKLRTVGVASPWMWLAPRARARARCVNSACACCVYALLHCVLTKVTHPCHQTASEEGGAADDGKLVQAEHRESGAVRLSTYAFYMRAVGWPMVAIAVCTVIITEVLGMAQLFWLGEWSDSPALGTQAGVTIFLIGLTSITLGTTLSIATQGWVSSEVRCAPQPGEVQGQRPV